MHVSAMRAGRHATMYPVWGELDSRRWYGVCQYHARCYHSEACMAGVGNDVTHLGVSLVETRPYCLFSTDHHA